MGDVDTAPIRFGIVGSGWRSEFFVRLARALPERLAVAGVVTRSAERAEQVRTAWGVPAYRTVGELLAAEPEFVIPSVPWDVTPGVVRDLVEQGVPVLAETPPAPDAAGLRELWSAVGGARRAATGGGGGMASASASASAADGGALVQVAEQYVLMPGHAARIALVRDGVIGAATSVQLSSTHMYHAMSLIRHTLGIGFGPATVTARAFTAPLADPLSPKGWSDDLTPKDATTTLALIDFGAGRTGLYDFTDNQWWNPLRARRVVVRGSLGEIVDDSVVRMADPRTPVESALVRRRTGTDLNLEGAEVHHISFDGRVVWRNDYVGASLSEDDLAVVDLLCRTGAWVRGEGPEPYPLAEGCQDHLLALAVEESARTGAPVTTAEEAWATA
ncbi:Gfo/Idh/MocA family oxidoreductase [Streptomyces sp. NBC_00669]|uniref:Gfo/Idh/MocA family protein n=1 Tax=Streptomyces sp. NBC_00669 TaxID=2976011 RepID=UPI002E34548C|nr:Gfo/Idh/MocA family oxidoreductase [Streptomyces sp. NBC_00669]